MSWQKCPLCNGSGLGLNEGLYTAIPICSVCQGQKIISEVTGLPPGTFVNVDVNVQGLEKDPRDIIRFTIRKRTDDPQILVDEIAKEWSLLPLNINN